MSEDIVDWTKFATGGRLIYAVGDIHGRDDLFAKMVVEIELDMLGCASSSTERPVLILLGDYIDRGPKSRQVIDRILKMGLQERFELRCLYGNHEEAMIEFLDQRTGGVGWLNHGGGPTMLSYGVLPPAANAEREKWSSAREALQAAVPAAHQEFMRSLELHVEYGDFLFVHAGLRPGVPLGEQTQRDMLWIRDSFLKSEEGFDQIIVHGHSPAEKIHMDRRRIGLDTGAYASGTLSAIRLGVGDPFAIQVRPGVRVS